ncbi:MAG: pilus assembly protein PilM [Candidatus Pacebacteria bacterium]|nr:pilus assembly protein PilM [Candidatus Paceibacterota bacterium]
MKGYSSFFKYFPTPKYMGMSHVGFEISSNAIRYIEIVKSPKGLTLGRFGIQELPNPVVFDEHLSSNQDLMLALKKIQKVNKFNFVEISIPEEKAYLFTTEIPTGNDEAIRSHIEFHLEENVPVALADTVFDYHIIKENSKKGTDFASVSVVPRGVIEDYISLFEKCGMTPVSFLIENQAITRSIIALDDMQTYLVVNIGKTKTVLSIVNEQTVQFTSTVNIGGDNFASAIAKENSISKEAAERMIKEKGFVRTENNNDFFLSLINVVSALRDEIQRVYMYWLSHIDKNGKDPTAPFKVLLTGRDSSIIGFREYMALSLKVPVDLANVWVNVFSFDQEIPPIEHLESLNYATVIGLALPKSKY